MTNQLNEEINKKEYFDDEINLLDYWRVIKKRSKLIWVLCLFSIVTAAIFSLNTTPVYQAKATLMPVESSQGRISVALGALQNLPFVGGAVGGALGKTASDKLISILNSRTVTENVIKTLDLTKVLFKEKGDWKKEIMNFFLPQKPPTLQKTVELLQKGLVKISDDRKGLISISVEYKDPHLAADIANEYLNALQNFLSSTAISMAKRNRIFLEKQLQLTKQDLKAMEESLKDFQTSKKIAALDAQSEAAIKALAELKTQIITREVQLGALREFATKQHPDVKRIEDEIRELRHQLKRLEEGSASPKAPESIGAFLTLAEAPTVGLEYARKKRDALIQQKVFELLTQQYELAKIEEAKEEIAFQVIDSAIPPEKPVKPKIALNLIIAGVTSLFLGILLVFFLEYLEKMKARRSS